MNENNILTRISLTRYLMMINIGQSLDDRIASGAPLTVFDDVSTDTSISQIRRLLYLSILSRIETV